MSATEGLRRFDSWVIDTGRLRDFAPVARILASWGLVYCLALTTFFVTDTGLPTNLVEVALVLPWSSLPLAGVVLGKRPRSLAALSLSITTAQVTYVANDDTGCCAGGHFFAILMAPVGILTLVCLLCLLISRRHGSSPRIPGGAS